jgi:hypothetical protein
MVDPAVHRPSDLVRRLSVASWGVCCGILLATAITAVLVAANGDTWNQHHKVALTFDYVREFGSVPWQERYERTWYALVCIAGALCGWAAIRYSRVSPWLALAAALAFVPVALWACRGVFVGKFVTIRLLDCAAILAVPLLLRTRNTAVALPRMAACETQLESPRPSWFAAGVLSLLLSAILYGTLAPHDVGSVASECNTELHVASYIIGPALYYHAPGIVPALDFESHYGIGHAYTFSLVMGSHGLQTALERYVVFLLAVTILFYLSALWVLTDWLRNSWVAFAVTLAMVAVSYEGLAYCYPSGWPIRYPFLFAFLFAAVRGVDRPRWCAVAGGFAGLSLWWQTDIGLCALVAGVGFYLACALFHGGSWWRPVVLLAVGIGTFLSICTAFFGPRVISITFGVRLLEPLLLYATGFGNVPMTWRPGWSYWYNLLGPGLAIGTVAVMISYRHREGVQARGLLYAALASMAGLAMLFKWVNRSFDVLWGLNGGLVIAAAGWWARMAWRAISERLAVDSRPSAAFVRRFAAAGAIVALIAQGVGIDARCATTNSRGDCTSPILRVLNWICNFPNPINSARKDIKPRLRPSPVDQSDVDYLRDRTRPDERVAVISGNEWIYLAEASRAPRLHWLQLFLVHSPVLLDRCVDDLRASDRVFVDRDAFKTLEGLNPDAYAAVVPCLLEQFEVVEESSPRWLLYRRKPGVTAADR